MRTSRTVYHLMPLLALCATTAPAQDYRVELSGSAGYTFSDGVRFPPGAPGDLLFDRIAPKNAFNFTLAS